MKCRKSVTAAIAAYTLCFLGVTVCPGAEIKLKNGKTFSGDIISESENFIMLNTGGPEINISKALISEIDGAPVQHPFPAASEQPGKKSGKEYRKITFTHGSAVTITLKNGTSFRGKILSENANLIILDVDGSRVNIFKNMIDSINGKKVKKEAPVPEEHKSSPAVTPSQTPGRKRADKQKAETPAPPESPVNDSAKQVENKTVQIPDSSLAEKHSAAAPPVTPDSPEQSPVSSTGAEEKSAAGEVLATQSAQPSPAQSQPISPDPEKTQPATRTESTKKRTNKSTFPAVQAPAPSPPVPSPVQAPVTAPVPQPQAPVQQDVSRARSTPNTSSVASVTRPVESLPQTNREMSTHKGTKNDIPDIQRLMEKLKSPLHKNRIIAAISLAQMKEEAEPALELLIGAFSDTVMYTPDSTEQVIDRPTSVSDEAAGAVIAIGSDAVKPLVSALEHPAWPVRAQAAYSLGEIGDLKADKHLIRTLTDTSLFVRDKTMSALVNLNNPRPLIRALRDRDSDLKKNVIEVLGAMKAADAVEPLIRQLENRDSYVREKAAYALGEIGDSRAVEPLIGLLDDNISFVRHNAIEALEKIGDKSAIQPIRSALKDQSSYVREKAAIALKTLTKIEFDKFTGDLESLISALRHEDSDVRKKAANTLWLRTGKKFGTDYEKWKSWWEAGKKEKQQSNKTGS
ncbi:MAG: hypothetical protein GF350_02765 [Chitinivibrionales bacterium]|nr:hypothetical protein [Chitinivibrionales bacterium]